MNNAFDSQNKQSQNHPGTPIPGKSAQNYAIAALILGVASLVSNLWCIMGLPILFGVLAFIMAHLSKKENGGIGLKNAKYGIIFGIVGTVLGGVALIVSVVLRFLLSLGFSAMWRSLLREIIHYIKSSETIGALLQL